MPQKSAIAVVEVGKPVGEAPPSVVPDAELAPHEVLVKVKVVGLAPLDAKFRDRNPFRLPLPIILGGDVVGIVQRCGSDVSFPRDSVIFTQRDFKLNRGCLQEYTIVDGRYASIVPPGISDVEAALYPINAVTSGMAMFTAEGFGWPFPETAKSAGFDYGSQHLVIVGGGTNTGKLAIQMASLAGVGSVVAIASKSNEKSLKELGATHVIDRHGSPPEIKRQCREAVKSKVLHVLDTYGSFDMSATILSDIEKGVLIHLVHGSVSEDVAAQKQAVFRKHHIQGFSGSDPEFGRNFWEIFPRWMEDKRIKPLDFKVIQGLDPARIDQVLDEYSAGKGGARYHVKLA